MESKRSGADQGRDSTKDLLAAMPLSPCPEAALVSVFSQLKSFEPAHSDTATHPSAKSTLIRKFIKRALLLDTIMIAEETTDVELEDPGLNTGLDIGLSFLICRVEIKPAQPPLHDYKAPMGEWM